MNEQQKLDFLERFIKETMYLTGNTYDRDFAIQDKFLEDADIIHSDQMTSEEIEYVLELLWKPFTG